MIAPAEHSGIHFSFTCMHDLVALGVLREMAFGKAKLFLRPKLMQLLGSDTHHFQPYA